MDYFITDDILNPPENEEADSKLFTEKFLRMPVNFAYAQREDVPKPEYAPCTKRDYPVFGTICDYSEINDDILKIWLKISELVPKAVFLMRAKEFESISTINQLYDRMKAIGFNMDKVLFRPPSPNYMQEMLHLDVVLDVYPLSAVTSTIDALYMGVPVVSFYAQRRSSKFGKTITKAIGLPDLATPSVEGYINRAVSLVTEVKTLDVLHKNLREMVKRAQPLNPKTYMTIIEQKFEELVTGKPAIKEIENQAEGKTNEGQSNEDTANW